MVPEQSMKVSFLMSVYERENPEYLRVSLRSLCAQTCACEELILVEDGPLTAVLVQIIDDFRDRLPIVSVRLPVNRGLAAALNEGLKHCRSDLVARMDSDDICFPDRLAKQLAVFEMDPSVAIVGSFAVEIDRQGVQGRLRSMPVTHEGIVDNLWACPLIHPAVIFRRESILGVGGYDASLKRRQDYELWFRCAIAGLRFANVDQPLLLYRFCPEAYRKQPAGLAFKQALIGYRGASRLKMAFWKRAACFVPFLRSMLPGPLQNAFYRISRHMDPRQKRSGVGV